MNRPDLDAIREREAAAAAGPWTYEGRVLWGRDEFGRIKADTPADRAFTEHAREDVPALLAEVERLRTDLRHQHTEFLVMRSDRDDAYRRGAERMRDQVVAYLRREHAVSLDVLEIARLPLPGDPS